MHELQLHVEGQAGGDAVWVDFVAGEPFGLKKQLMLDLPAKRWILSSMDGQ